MVMIVSIRDNIKTILEKYGVKVRSGFSCVRAGNELSGYMKVWNVLICCGYNWAKY